MKQSAPAASDFSHSALDLFKEVRHLHPNLHFCGEPPDAFLTLPDELTGYLFALLSGAPQPTPQVHSDEWTQLIATLKAHWVLPLVYWHVGHVPERMRPPREVMEALRGSFQWSRIRTLLMEQQLQQLTAAFRDGGVRMIVLKGPALGRMVYPDPALRPGSDLDILVHPEDMQQSRVLLKQLGYNCEIRRFGTDLETRNHHEEFESIKNAGHYRAIELHWKLHPFGITQEVGVDELLDRAVHVVSNGITFEALHPVDAFIHRALNNAFIHDQDIRLIWVYDILMLARNLKEPEEWSVLQERCVDWNARHAVELALTLAKSWYALNLPEEFADFSLWPAPSANEIKTWKHITQRSTRLDFMALSYLPSGVTLFKRLWSAVRLIVPPRAVVVKSFPVPHPWLFPLAYIRRWGKWINKLLT